MSKPDWQPLEYRTYKHKNPKMEFFCPLCTTKRAFHSTPRLSAKNYFQLTLSSILAGAALYPLMGIRSYFVFFIFWALFEAAVRMNFRKEIPCPHCGFDASWYKKDVKMAKKIVHEFWENKNPTPEIKEKIEDFEGAVVEPKQQTSTNPYASF
ncbi:hypothetical protein [Halobacteriovorax sp. JY17]|uniref:hypothetical protein n=1 Tax=Halobacteriovorax sp. JY17 TaxID=2014617 RepID=UPI000C4904FF|nr:hypothetical protein [Halobacteriovorax sp. JY17]PIK13830.1 MAG: hypothetical protein CES88_12645 [Halobacteriovorax sp. JY17]